MSGKEVKMIQQSNMPSRNKHRSIRDMLEEDAWRRTPGLARRLWKRKNPAKQPPGSWQDGSRRVMRWQDRIMLTLSAILLMLLVIRAETASADQPNWGLELMTDIGSHTELAVDTDIQLEITGLVSRVAVTQRFSNRGMYWAEGIYRFPLPEGAAVDRLRVRVGERLLEGEIQEKETARRRYEQARDAGQTATVVEQQRRNQFETRLANIAPGETIEVTIGFLQTVSFSHPGYSLRLPMTFTPRWEPPDTAQETSIRGPAPKLVPAGATPGHSLSLRASLVSPIELAAIESRYHDVDIRQVESGYQVELLNSGELSDRDFELAWTPALGAQPAAFLTQFNDGDSVYVQLMMAPPIAEAIQPVAREVVLIIDTSGSMDGPSITQAKAALLHALDSLGGDDYFNLLQFNSSTELLFRRSVPVTTTNLEQAVDFIQRLEANGGTDMAPALHEALSLPTVDGLMRQVVFVTDGAVGNETELLQQVAHELDDSRMFTVAIGSAPNSWFMRKAAEIGRGSFVQIAKPEEVGERMSSLWQRIELPALTDICVDWGDSAEYYPEIVPDLYAGQPLWLIARMPSSPGVIELCGKLDGQDWQQTVYGWEALDLHDGGDNLAKLWARQKVESLEDSLLFGADPELTRLQITEVALDYELLTAYTSLVAVDRTPRRQAGDLLAAFDIPGLLPAGSSRQLASFPGTASGWLARSLLSAFVLLLATAMLLFSGSRIRRPKCLAVRKKHAAGESMEPSVT
jgi:Ca-activated chloride channel family protein